MEKYGFVYIWRDRKRNMYYIGCHWGTIEDSYICSSDRMRDAYYRRKEDFKRRIVKTNISRDLLLEEEFKWLSLIPDEQLGKKYYNLSKKHFGHWSNTTDKRTTIEKIKEARSKQIFSEETHKKRGQSLQDFYKTEKGQVVLKQKALKNTGKKRSEETKQKISEALTGQIRGPLSDNTKEKLRIASTTNNSMHNDDVKVKHLNKVQSPEHRKMMSEKMKGKKPKNIPTGFWWNNGQINKRAREQPEGFIRGKLAKKSILQQL